MTMTSQLTSSRSLDGKGRARINQYELYETLGKGSYGLVKTCTDIDTLQVYAVKIIPRCQYKPLFFGYSGQTQHQVEMEMACLLKLSHKNIIGLKEIIDDPRSEKVYLVMDFCQNGTLHDKLEETESGLPEPQVKTYFRSLISAIHYCHEVQNIAHRDIKPENLMLSDAKDSI